MLYSITVDFNKEIVNLIYQRVQLTSKYQTNQNNETKMAKTDANGSTFPKTSEAVNKKKNDDRLEI